MDKKDEIILQQLDVIRTMTQNNLNRMGSDFWGTPLTPDAPKSAVPKEAAPKANAPKSADGMKALEWWKEGRVEEIRRYCQMDVEITRRLYEFGRENHYLLFTNKAGQKTRVPVHW
mgnify:CR=1 FL=1